MTVPAVMPCLPDRARAAATKNTPNCTAPPAMVEA